MWNLSKKHSLLDTQYLLRKLFQVDSYFSAKVAQLELFLVYIFSESCFRSTLTFQQRDSTWTLFSIVSESCFRLTLAPFSKGCSTWILFSILSESCFRLTLTFQQRVLSLNFVHYLLRKLFQVDSDLSAKGLNLNFVQYLLRKLFQVDSDLSAKGAQLELCSLSSQKAVSGGLWPFSKGTQLELCSLSSQKAVSGGLWPFSKGCSAWTLLTIFSESCSGFTLTFQQRVLNLKFVQYLLRKLFQVDSDLSAKVAQLELCSISTQKAVSGLLWPFSKGCSTWALFDIF